MSEAAIDNWRLSRKLEYETTHNVKVHIKCNNIDTNERYYYEIFQGLNITPKLFVYGILRHPLL